MPRQQTGKIWRCSDEEFSEIIRVATSYSDALRAFGLQHKGGNGRTLKARITALGLSTDHFQVVQPLPANKRELSDILVKGSTYSNCGHLKRRLIADGLIAEKCYECGIPAEWNGKPLALVLHHVNGEDDDHRIDNLALLCPNCHAQTDNYAGKSIKLERSTCGMCGTVLHLRNASGFCRVCLRKAYPTKRKVERPPLPELLSLVSERGYSATGRLFGVSATTIKNWLKSQ